MHRWPLLFMCINFCFLIECIECLIQIAQYVATEVMLWWYQSWFIHCNGSLSLCMCQRPSTLQFISLLILCASVSLQLMYMLPQGCRWGAHAYVCVWPSVYTSKRGRMRWWWRGMGSLFWANKIEIACIRSPGASPRQGDYSDSLLGRHLTMWNRNIGINNTTSMTLNCPQSHDLPNCSNVSAFLFHCPPML